MKRSGLLILLSLLLCIIAFAMRDLFLSFTITYIASEEVSFQNSWKLPDHMIPCLLFVISIGIIPLLSFILVEKICELKTLSKKLFSIILIVFTGLIFLLSRILFLKIKASKIKDLLQRAEFVKGAEIPRIRFEDMILEVYLIIGLLVGTLMCILIFRKRKTSHSRLP